MKPETVKYPEIRPLSTAAVGPEAPGPLASLYAQQHKGGHTKPPSNCEVKN